MGDLEDLAAARLQKSPERAVPVRTKTASDGFRAALLRHRWIAGGVAALVVIAAISISAYQYGKTQQRREIGDAFVSAISGNRASMPKMPDPKFTIAETGLLDWTNKGWSITNEDSTPLTVSKVVLNGEWLANLGNREGDSVSDAGKAQPVTLAIGESQAYFVYSYGYPVSYVRKIIFIDIFTSRGNFRYRVDEGFVDEKPADGEGKIDQHRKDLEAEALKQKQQADERAKNFFGVQH